VRHLWRRLALGLLIGVGIPTAIVIWGWIGPGPLDRPTTVIVEEGATLSATARNLERAGVVGSSKRFLTGAKLFGSHDPIQAGEFRIGRKMAGSAVLDLLQHGKPVQRLITVTEGMPSIVVAEKLAANPYLTGPTPAIAEGTALPDSYGYKRGESRAAVAKRMQSA
jgi:UPF0755 protein